MPTSFRPYHPTQSYLLPPSPQDWLPEGHLVYFVSETVEQLDLEPFYAVYEGDGRRNQPFDPRMMVKVLLYSYATGTFSSRKIAKKLEEDVAYRVLSAGNFPAHRTLCEFRQRHLSAFRVLFGQVVRIAQEAGFVKLGALAVDGSKVRAHASKHKAMSYGRMLREQERLEREIEELTNRAAEVDEDEDREYGAEQRGDELPKELRRRETRLRKIREAKERVEARQRAEDEKKGRHAGDGRKSPRDGRPFKRDFGVPPDKAQDNFTDPDSRIMKSSGAFQQCYNPQIAVEETSQIIVAARLTQNASDSGELLPMLDAVEEVTGSQPSEVLADAGYKSEANFESLEQREIEGYVSLGREGKSVPSPSDDIPATQRIAAKLQTPAGSKRYRRRKAIVEPVFGWIEQILGFRQFSLRGFEKVQDEWSLVCLAVNLKHLHTLQRAG